MNLTTLIRRAPTNPEFVEVARTWASRLTALLSNPGLSETTELIDPFPILRDAVLDRAYTLGAFILGDTKRAKQVAIEVATSLEVPYQIRKDGATSRDKSRHPYKVKEPSLLLDRIIYKKITVHERQQEFEHLHGGVQLDDEALTIRFVKKIIEYSITHNTFYMVVGLDRVLFNYDNNEARRIYQQLVPCPDDKKPGADDFRHHKKRFIDHLERRFKDFVDVVEYGDQHERRFKKRRDSSLSYLLVEQTLNLLKPSLTVCPISGEKLGPADGGKRVPHFHTSIQEDKDEHLIEKERMHMLTHLFCFSRLAAHLGLAPARRVLELPHFKTLGNSGDSASPPVNHRDPPPLTPAEKRKMYAELDKRRRRGKKISPEKVQVVIDNIERGTLSLDERQSVSIELEEGAGIIEFKCCDEKGGLPLGIHPLNWDESAVSDEPESYRMRIKGGRELRFTIAYSKDMNGNVTGAKMLCSYSNLHQPVIVPQPMAELRDWLSNLTPGFVLQAPSLRVVTLTAICVMAFGTFLYMGAGQNPSSISGDEASNVIGPLTAANLSSIKPPPLPLLQSDDRGEEMASPVVGQADATVKKGVKQAKPVLKETVIVKADKELIAVDHIPPLATLSSETSRKVIDGDVPGVLASGTVVITLPLTNRDFVKLSDLPQDRISTNFDPASFLVAKQIFVKPFAESTLSQGVYSNLIEALQANSYTISRDISKAEAILEGRVVENGSGVTLRVLMNSRDGRLIWLKSLNSQNRGGTPTLVAKDLSARVVRSLSDERRENVYVALDYYLSQTTKMSQDRPLAMPDIDAGDDPLRQVDERLQNTGTAGSLVAVQGINDAPASSSIK
jgi:hypothetical protein